MYFYVLSNSTYLGTYSKQCVNLNTRWMSNLRDLPISSSFYAICAWILVGRTRVLIVLWVFFRENSWRYSSLPRYEMYAYIFIACQFNAFFSAVRKQFNMIFSNTVNLRVAYAYLQIIHTFFTPTKFHPRNNKQRNGKSSCSAKHFFLFL